jgi:hypothetical protein
MDRPIWGQLSCNYSIYRMREANRQALRLALRMGRPFSLVRFPTILA